MTRAILISALVWCALVTQPRAQQAAFAPDRPATPLVPGTLLGPTDHPRLPLTVGHLWLAPDLARPSGSTASLAAGLNALDREGAAEAIGILSQVSAEPGVLVNYGLLGLARAQLSLSRGADALRTIRLIQQREPVGFIREAAALVEGDALEAGADDHAALAVYERLSRERPAALDEVLMRVARTAERVGEVARAAEAYARVYYELPLSDHASTAKAKLDTLMNASPAAQPTDRMKLAIGRAQRLFDTKQYAPARAAFAAAAPAAAGADRDLVQLRLAECDYLLKRHRDARSGAAALTEQGPYQAEALYYYALSTRALGDQLTYVKTMRRVADSFPELPWAEEALNDLATRYIRADDDVLADEVLRELVARYPRSRFAERAVWKVGWRAFDAGRYDETAELFDRAAANFPRSDFRPAWLFWSARAHALAGREQVADARYALTATDYLNSYYGRLAVARLNGQTPAPRIAAAAAGPVVPPPPNDQIVRALLEIHRYDDALNEVRYARQQWGDTPALQATISWIYRQQGFFASGREQFNLLRGSITLMRRAYPQFMAAGGELLPREVLSLIFPLSYWELIQKHSEAQRLDPYLVAALVAQESTFVPDVRSSANAIGLMQLIPSTARVYARKLGLRYSVKLLEDPESNIRMGTAYLADKMQEFGDPHLALASYNAGEGAVRRWLAARHDRPVDQFIDDIPYPETQNYVKRILGTQEDYRRLYGAGRPSALQSAAFGSSHPTPPEAQAGPGAGDSRKSQKASSSTKKKRAGRRR
jgi:soluble lytic murein transglycosylase